MIPGSSTTDATRRYDIDWLRVFATYLLFVFHVAMVFNPAPFYHIRNADLSFGMLVLSGFISLWHMPLFFLLAGWSACSSLQARGRRDFLKERIFKLWIPLVMGCALVCPPIKYLELRSGLDLNYAGLRVSPALEAGFKLVIPGSLPVAAPFDETFRTFLPSFFTHLSRFSWSHLWFIAYLFTFTVLYQPLLGWLMRLRPLSPNTRVSSAWVYLPTLPLALIQLTLRERWPGIQNLFDDWANIAYYSTYLFAGFLLARFPEFEAAAYQERTRALTLGIATVLVLLVAVLGVFSSPTILLAGSAIAGWCFIVALLGFANRYLARTSTILPYLTESAFPVYILHQPAIVLIGYGLIQLSLGIAAKFTLLLIAAVVATLGVYHLVVRRFAMTRFLLGMKPKARYAHLRALAPTTAVLIVGVIFGLLFSHPARAETPMGLWYAEGGAAQVEVTACGEGLCGRVVWLRSPFDEDGCEQRDNRNPDPALRDRPLVGIQILAGLEAIDARAWSGGTIYDPASGNTYRCSLQLDGENRLRLRGYIGVPLLGRTTTWIRAGMENQMCKR
ncbi:MAG: DUF2147 domain-containing protein [Deltaproteobacteria bacterium]|nr:DUF2147 domain-containing protein [Deltaproteobacteria bacterium]MBI3389934.1 DUF2147 domain-containing protein [Deltaproteobacteria bacterium]